jgi:hypothetical protein
MGKDIHVSRTDDNRWQARREGAQRASVVADKQSAVWDAARQIAKNDGVEAYLHGRNGQIRERNTYGHDPYPPPG